MSTGRLISAGLAIISLAVLVLSSVSLAQRIAKYHEDNPRPLFYSIRTDLMSFEFEGRPVEFKPDLDDAGDGAVTVSYGDDTDLLLPVEVPQEIDLPKLDRFLDWMQVFFFAENADREPLEAFREHVRSGEADLRCAIVVRRIETDPQQEPGFLGVEAPAEQFREVKRDRWVFDFHELMPDGSIDSHTLRMPESGASFYRRQVKAYQQGASEPERAADELRERTWEWDLALQTMPRPPAITKENQALLYAGWTLPTASAAAIIMLLSIAFTFAPPRRTPGDGDTPPASPKHS